MHVEHRVEEPGGSEGRVDVQPVAEHVAVHLVHAHDRLAFVALQRPEVLRAVHAAVLDDPALPSRPLHHRLDRLPDEFVVALPPSTELHVDGQRLGIVRADERDADEVVPHADLARRAVAPHRHALHALSAEDLADVREVDRERAAVEAVLGDVLQQPSARRLDEVVVPEPPGDALLGALAFRLRRIRAKRLRQVRDERRLPRDDLREEGLQRVPFGLGPRPEHALQEILVGDIERIL